IQNSFKLQTIVLLDSGAQINCIQEELIPTIFFEKTEQKLSTANGENLRVKFKIFDVHICNEGIYIKQSFILVKDNLDIGIILGQQFLEIIKSFKVTNKGITTKLIQQKILFTFNEKSITKEVNLLKTLSIFKEYSINLIITKEKYFSNKKLEQQLLTSQIHNFLNKKLIRPNKSPLSYVVFYLNKNSETPKFVINYKLFNIIRPLHIVRHPIPNKKDLHKRLTESYSTIPFKHYE
ncbi:RVP domain-containing protein, partial [Cephalotus follicularis]